MQNEMSLTLGILCSIGLIINIIYCIYNRNNNTNIIKFLKILTLTSLLFLIASTTIFPWEELSVSNELINIFLGKIQFVWRFLGISTLCITLVSSIIIGKYIDSKFSEKQNFIENYKIIFGIGFIALISVVLFLGDFSKQNKCYTNESTFDYNMSNYKEYFIKGTSMSSFVKDNYKASEGIKILKYNKVGNKIVIDYENPFQNSNSYIDVPLLYYPIYYAKDNKGNLLKIECNDQKLIRVYLNNEENVTITISSNEHGKYIIFDIISIITLFLLIIYLILKHKKLLSFQ